MTNTMKTWVKVRQHLVIAALTLALIGTVAFPVSTETAAAATAQPATQATAANPEIPIKSVSFPSTVTLKKGESRTLNVSVSPSNTTYLTNIEWGRQTNGCFSAKVNGYGTYWKGQSSSETITGTNAGEGYLNTTVKVFDSTGKYITKYSVKTTVKVSGSTTQPTTKATQPTTKATQPTTKTTKSVALNSISLSKSSVSLNPGKTTTLSVYYNPSNTTASKSVSWTSSNSAVAKVSGGKITAVKAGSATITANCNGKKATCKVTVQAAAKYRNVSEAYTVLNKFRTTKSNQWYWKSNNKTKQKVTGLKALKRDTELEKVAKLRAKEQWTMYYNRGEATHTRPNGKAWSTAYPKSLTYRAENLAWGHTSCKAVIAGEGGWAETNEKYKYQGHRRNMLNKTVTKVGIACYEKNGKTCWAMCLAK